MALRNARKALVRNSEVGKTVLCVSIFLFLGRTPCVRDAVSIITVTFTLMSSIIINEINTTGSSGIVELRFLDSSLLLFFAFGRIGHVFPHLWPQGVWPGGRLLPRQSLPDQGFSSGGFSSNIVNQQKPVHVSDKSRSPSTFHNCNPGHVNTF